MMRMAKICQICALTGYGIIIAGEDLQVVGCRDDCFTLGGFSVILRGEREGEVFR